MYDWIIIWFTVYNDSNYNNILISHIMLLVLIEVFSLLTSILYVLLKNHNLYNRVLYTTLLFVMVLLYIFYFKKDLIKKYLKMNIIL